MKIGRQKHLDLISSIRGSIWDAIESQSVTNTCQLLRDDVNLTLEDLVWNSSYEAWEGIVRDGIR
jgi:hypothetical protein